MICIADFYKYIHSVTAMLQNSEAATNITFSVGTSNMCTAFDWQTVFQVILSIFNIVGCVWSEHRMTQYKKNRSTYFREKFIEWKKRREREGDRRGGR